MCVVKSEIFQKECSEKTLKKITFQVEIKLERGNLNIINKEAALKIP